MRPITVLAASTTIALMPVSSALAQRQAPTPEQRIERLERQVDEMQRRLYPKGRPADTAGYVDDPAATQSSVISLSQRLDALEHQMADLVRQSEENGNRLHGVETSVSQLRSDDDKRISALEQRMTTAEAAAQAAAQQPVAPVETPPVAKSKGKSPPPKASEKVAEVAPPPSSDEASTAAASDPGEDAYSQGFHLWEAGKYDDAISTLKSFISTYPTHPRISYAKNLIGRAQLDEGDARAAAETLLANYRSNPGGARAPDSLYYLGQALMKLGQPGQACKAYGELDAVYGAKIRPDLKKLETDAKAQANCG